MYEFYSTCLRKSLDYFSLYHAYVPRNNTIYDLSKHNKSTPVMKR